LIGILGIEVLGLSVGYLVGHYLMGLGSTTIVINPAVIDSATLLLIMILSRNFVVALVVFLLGRYVFIQDLVVALALLYDGLLISYVPPLIALMGVLPHGVFELLGFAEVAVAGRGFVRGGAFLRSLLLGVVLIIVAGFIESFVTLGCCFSSFVTA
jgi:hypothetical protein